MHGGSIQRLKPRDLNNADQQKAQADAFECFAQARLHRGPRIARRLGIPLLFVLRGVEKSLKAAVVKQPQFVATGNEPQDRLLVAKLWFLLQCVQDYFIQPHVHLDFL
jgi:hypothetical protein